MPHPMDQREGVPKSIYNVGHACFYDFFSYPPISKLIALFCIVIIGEEGRKIYQIIYTLFPHIVISKCVITFSNTSA